MRSEAGQSLTEVIIAATVGVFVVTALTFATIFSLRNASFAKNSSQATKLAQQGLEWVRTGRDRNTAINNISGSNVTRWNGINTTQCPTNSAAADDSIWCYQISPTGCDNTSTGGKCYFKVNSTGVLNNIGFAFVPTASNPLPSQAEGIPAANPIFKRAVILSDDADFDKQKKVTVIVTWSDAAGPHDSRLSTILRRL